MTSASAKLLESSLGIDAEQLASDYLANPVADNAAWILSQGYQVVDPEKASDALKDLILASFFIGTATGLANVTNNRVEWLGWVVGQVPPVSDSLALRELTDQVAETLSGINETRLKRLAAVLTSDLGQEDLTRVINDHIDEVRREWAQEVAITESRKAVVGGLFNEYQRQNVSLVRWVVGSGNPCSFCIEQSRRGPQPLLSFVMPPAHPWCQCDLLPVMGLKAARQVVKDALEALDEIPMVDEDHIAVPWPITKRPKLDPEVWEDSALHTVRVEDLYASQKLLTKDRVAFFIKSQGSIEPGRRALPNVYALNGRNVIVDGHHRLAALWLMGADMANVWFLEE